MKKNILLTFIFYQVTIVVYAQTWVQKANFGGAARQGLVAFTIGNYAYAGLGMVTGNTLVKDYWKYDPSTDVWTQIADFGGTVRFSATCFVIGNKGYVGTGTDQYPNYNWRKDFWQYDPSTNTWTEIADFIGTPRYSAAGLTIGTKGYVGLGWDGNWFDDFYEYDPVSNTWTQKANFAGGQRQDVAFFTIGNFGYIGLGTGSGGAVFGDFWKYDPVADSWTEVASLPGVARFGAAYFVLNNNAYVGLGSNDYFSASPLSDFYEYNPVSDSWNTLPNFNGTARLNQASFAIGCNGYVCTGSSEGYSQFYRDVWVYTTSVTASIAATPAAQCADAPVEFTSNTTGATSYLWQFGDGSMDTSADPIHIYADSGTYIARFIAQSSGCAADTLFQTIKVNKAPVDSFLDASPCGFTADFKNLSKGFTSLLWNFGDGDTSTALNPPHTYQDSGIYNVSLIVTSGNGCNDTTRLIVDVPNNSVINFLTNELPCNSKINFENTSINAVNYFWDFGDESTSAIESPVHSYNSTGNYTVTLTINKGSSCEKMLSEDVKVTTASVSDIFIPNAFTPNGDGKNDVFRIATIDSCNSYELLIFNRWGQLLLDTTSQPLTWDGIYHGKIVPDGCYCYLLKGINTELEKHGVVTLIR